MPELDEIEREAKRLVEFYRANPRTKRETIAQLIELVADVIGRRLRRTFHFQNQAEIEDCFQEFALYFYKHEANYKPERALIPYLWMLACSRTKDYFRREKRHRHSSLAQPSDRGGDPADSRHNPAETDKTFALKEALSSLSPAQYQVAYLCWVEGYTMKEAALELGLKDTTVQARLNAAKEQLRKVFASRGREKGRRQS
jgi:RNA polymerase sigma-70 factor (ECF subfamily)